MLCYFIPLCVVCSRVVLVREGAQPGSLEDITPAGFSVRTIVHEYGGGAFTVKGDNIVFSNYADQRLYLQSINGGTDLSNHQLLLLCPELCSCSYLVSLLYTKYYISISYLNLRLGFRV